MQKHLGLLSRCNGMIKIVFSPTCLIFEIAKPLQLFTQSCMLDVENRFWPTCLIFEITKPPQLFTHKCTLGYVLPQGVWLHSFCGRTAWLKIVWYHNVWLHNVFQYSPMSVEILLPRSSRLGSKLRKPPMLYAQNTWDCKTAATVC